jgi:hypothetical protein
MKVIFLDIDGVLNSEEFACWCREFPDFVKKGGSNWVDPNAVKMITSLCEECDVKLVISSSRRMFDVKSTIACFKHYRDLTSLCKYIVGVTPRNSDDRIWESRGEEIQQYLNEHPEIENYVIVDDDCDMLPEQIGHFIQTDYRVGFTLKEFERFEEIFNKDNDRGGSFPEKKQKDYRRAGECVTYVED